MSVGFIVGGKATCPVEGLSIRTFADDGVHRFASKGKRARAVELVIHETVTRSVDSTIAVLKKRGLSVHLVMGADGALTQHGDLATDILWHASQHNGASFGVEVVNRIHPHQFVVLPKRWIVERTWSWLMNNRRLQLDYERDPIITEGFIWAAHSRYLLRRLTAN